MIALTVVVLLLLQTSLSFSALGRSDECEELLQVSVIHRHGDRTRDESTFPTDPYIDEQFYPYGLGQLTNKGKWRMYNVGVQLKQRYQCFLGDLYYPDLLDARSTNYNRTKASLALLSAGLFPPKGPLIWSLLNWIPIPYNYEKAQDDYLLGMPAYICPKYSQLFNEYLNGAGAELFAEDLPFYKYVSEHSGYNVTSPAYIYAIYFSIKTEEEWGFELPAWAKPYVDTEFKKGAIKQYKLQTATTELKKLSAGFYIKNLLENSLRKINNTLTPEGRKLFIYSSHEYNVANVLTTLGVYNDIVPNYGSHVIIELRKINGVYGFKFLLQNNEADGQVELLTVPGCDSFCPIDTFIELVKDILPESESDCNV